MNRYRHIFGALLLCSGMLAIMLAGSPDTTFAKPGKDSKDQKDSKDKKGKKGKKGKGKKGKSKGEKGFKGKDFEDKKGFKGKDFEDKKEPKKKGKKKNKKDFGPRKEDEDNEQSETALRSGSSPEQGPEPRIGS